MKNLKLIIITTFIGYIISAVLLIFSCENNTTTEIKSNPKYTVWVGSAIFSVGYDTDSYKDTLGYFTFTTTDGKTTMYKSDKILKVDVNEHTQE